MAKEDHLVPHMLQLRGINGAFKPVCSQAAKLLSTKKYIQIDRRNPALTKACLDLRSILVTQKKLYKMFNMVGCEEGKKLLEVDQRLYVLKDFYLRVDKLRDLDAFQRELDQLE